MNEHTKWMEYGIVSIGQLFPVIVLGISSIYHHALAELLLFFGLKVDHYFLETPFIVIKW